MGVDAHMLHHNVDTLIRYLSTVLANLIGENQNFVRGSRVLFDPPAILYKRLHIDGKSV